MGTELVVDDRLGGIFRVNRRALTSPEVYERELAEVIERSWLYVGHESELPNPGDFLRRMVANRPVVFVRSRDDAQVRVLFNTCTHRGAMVCRQDRGNLDSFQCFYHGWVFDTSGRLKNVPADEAYTGKFDTAGLSLARPPRVESFHGMWFMSLDPDVAPLEKYLRGVADLVALSWESADVLGGWEILRGSADYNVQANWKLMVENSIDMYHFPTVHLTYARYQTEARKRHGKDSSFLPVLQESYGFSTAGGHGGFVHYADSRPIASVGPTWSEEANAETRRVRSALVDRFGEARGTEMAARSRHLLIYPNLIFQDSASGFRLRQIWPTGPGAMRVVQWEFRPREEIAELSAFRRAGSRAFLGPGGLGSPDDVEALESCQIGYLASPDGWNDVSRGVSKATFAANDEEQMRGFWRRWAEQVGSTL